MQKMKNKKMEKKLYKKGKKMDTQNCKQYPRKKNVENQKLEKWRKPS